jgi:hypothetical protein
MVQKYLADQHAGFCEEFAVNLLLAFLPNPSSSIGQRSHVLGLKPDHRSGEPQNFTSAITRRLL